MSAGPDGARAATRERIIGATLRCVERWGLAKTTIEDVAVAAALSRATVYRHFPGGRDQLVTETVAFEVHRVLGHLEDEVRADAGIEDQLVHALVSGHRAIGQHRLLHQVLATERDELLSELHTIAPLVLAEVHAAMRRSLGGETLRAGVDPDDAADYLARMFLSYLGSPGGVDLADQSAVRELVRSVLTGGIVVDGEP